MWVSELRGEYIGGWVGRFRRTEVGGHYTGVLKRTCVLCISISK